VGTIVDEKCPECRGTGGVTKTRTINVRIPPGSPTVSGSG
jgi:molecular chaperone DnaJ